MEKLKYNILTKNLFGFNICDIRINVICRYNSKTKHIGVNTFKKSNYKHSKKEILHVKRKNMTVCDILKQDVVDLQDDPERLSTAFKLKIIGSINNE